MQKATPELAAARRSLVQHAELFHRKAHQLENLNITDEVLNLAWILEQEWTTRRASECSRPDAAAPALKVAALLAIDEATEGKVPEVNARHFEYARLMGSRWIDSAVMLIDALGRTEFQQDCVAVLSSIKATQHGIRLSDLYRKHRRLKKKDFDQILEALKDQDEIAIPEPDDKTKGRPALMIFFNRRRSG
jgi:hypothetical protein